MSLLRCLGALSCLCLLAIPVQAQQTATTFSGKPTDTNFTYYSTQAALDGMVMNDGPPNAVNYFRLTYSGVGSTNNEIAFDQTDQNHVQHLEADFDFRLGGTAGAARTRTVLAWPYYPLPSMGQPEMA